jgi:hypothetical protein
MKDTEKEIDNFKFIFKEFDEAVMSDGFHRAMNIQKRIKYRVFKLLSEYATEIRKAKEEGYARGYVECNGDRNQLEKWSSLRELKTTQLKVRKEIRKKSREMLKEFIKLSLPVGEKDKLSNKTDEQ